MKTLNLWWDEGEVNYITVVSEEGSIPYPSVINFYFRGCAASNKKLKLRCK